ncbi:hypothetical protein D3C72_806400 [compost metagenome]
MARQFGRRVQRRGRKAAHAVAASLPVWVVLRAVDGGDAFVAGACAGADGKVHLIGLMRKAGLRSRLKPQAGGQVQRTVFAWIVGWPLRGASPLFRVQRVIVDRRLGIQARLLAQQIVIEEPQNFSKPGKVRHLRRAPRRHINACAMVPGPKQEVAGVFRQGQIARDSAIHVAAAVHPA